jgi:hypothetical protein
MFCYAHIQLDHQRQGTAKGLSFRLHKAAIFIFCSLCSDFNAAEIPAPVNAADSHRYFISSHCGVISTLVKAAEIPAPVNF